MRPSHRLELRLALATALAAGCGGGGGPDPGPPGGAGAFTAVVDGQPWAAAANTIAVTGNTSATRQGMLVITGYDPARGSSLLLSLSFFVGPATQPLGVNPGTTPGGTGAVVIAPATWMTPFDGASGFVTLTARTADRIAGTFHFTAAAQGSAAPAERTVTDGAFDLTLPGGLPPLPTGVGSTAVATVGGAPWYAATVVGLYPGPGTFSVAADNTAYSISLVPKTPVAAGNTYGVPSQMGLTVLRIGTAEAWSGGLGADVGSVTVTTFGEDRLVASFSATLPALNAAGPLTVTGGALNVHLEH